ncbi:hypothetical protein [Streptomyces canus]|uniref:hypothetical protein n=1 Tax=Streptomyces canus TaxID=58343 RepID=UPI003AF3B922
MRDLIVKVEAVDDTAAGALRVIDHFDAPTWLLRRRRASRRRHSSMSSRTPLPVASRAARLRARTEQPSNSA